MLISLHDLPEHHSSRYPEPFRSQITGRFRKKLGDAAGLKNFGVNWVRLMPGSQSALRHWHEKQDEFIYVIEGELILITNAGEQVLSAGAMAAFPAGEANGHHLVNRSTSVAVYLEVGDRTPGDCAHYPDVDLVAHDSPEGWQFTHKNGMPYPD